MIVKPDIRFCTYRLRLNDFVIRVVVLRCFGHLKCDLYETSREALDGNELAERRLQNILELAFCRAYIFIVSVSRSYTCCQQPGSLTSDPGGRSYDNINDRLKRVLISSLHLHRPIDG